MKTLTVLLLAGGLTSALLAASPLDKAKDAAKDIAQAAKDAAKDVTKDAKPAASSPSEAEMEAWMKAMTPGEHHALMKAFEGTWATTSKMRMTPDQPWAESTGSCTSTFTFGGRFLKTTYTGDMMGQPFHGEGLMGYDNIAKQYQSTWHDDMSTGIVMLTGSFDAEKKTFTLTGQCSCPTTGGQKPMKEVITLTSPNTYTMDFIDLDPKGNEFVSMTINYTRTAAAPATPIIPAVPAAPAGK
jgi:hypothetical protein